MRSNQNLISYNESSHGFIYTVKLDECHLPVLPAKFKYLFFNPDKIKDGKQCKNYGKNLKACAIKLADVKAFLISSSVTFGL
jgi:hypothetical protein